MPKKRPRGSVEAASRLGSMCLLDFFVANSVLDLRSCPPQASMAMGSGSARPAEPAKAPQASVPLLKCCLGRISVEVMISMVS